MSRNSGTVVLQFLPDASSKEIREFFNKFPKCYGTKVSSLTKTFAVDVPAEEERHYIELFYQDDLQPWVELLGIVLPALRVVERFGTPFFELFVC